MQIKTETKVGAFVILALAMLAYAAVYLGRFNWHSQAYESYTVLFTDVSGLTKKAEIKIAGVKVGWVEQIKLAPGGHQAEVELMINSQYQLYLNTKAEIHQEGLLGAKYIDLIPGNASTGRIAPGAYLSIKGQSQATVDELMQRFNVIAQNIEEVSAALKNVLGDAGQQEKVREIINSVSDFSAKVAPNLDRISNIFDRDFGRAAESLTHTLEAVESVAKKVDQGSGMFGKLVNDSQLYDDIKHVSSTFREATDAYERMGLVVDSHVESMARKDDEYDHKNSKGYFGVRLHTNEDWFYLFQMVGSEEGGVVSRNEIFNTYYNSLGERYTDAQLANLGGAYMAYPAVTKETRYSRNTIRYSYQIGRVFGNLAVRFGAFEDFFGVAADCNIFNNDYFRWVMTMEMFDFRGQNHLDDRRPHLKWLNRVYLFQNLYFNFGFDDFVSKESATPFFGLGLRFCDDDLKVLLSRFGMPTAKT